jgi:hypothetical protein
VKGVRGVRGRLIAVALLGGLAIALAAVPAWSRPKSAPGCPRRAVEADSPCKKKHATCRWACEGEGHSDLICACEKDEQGAWRWKCITGPLCVL